MTDYTDLVKRLRNSTDTVKSCDECPGECNGYCLFDEAADAIEELQAQLMYANDASRAIAAKVPKKPHGRLIDADALLKLIENPDDDGRFGYLDSLDITCAPTIIEAEEGE